MLKTVIVNFLVSILARLVPVEEHVSAAVRKAASTQIVKDAEAAFQAADRRARSIISMATAEAQSIQALAQAEYAAQHKAAKALAPVVTAEGAQAMVTAALIQAQPTAA